MTERLPGDERRAIETLLNSSRNELLKLTNALRDYADRQDLALSAVEVLLSWQNRLPQWIDAEYKKPRTPKAKKDVA